MIYKILITLFVCFGIMSYPAVALSTECILYSARNKEIVKIRGQAFSTGHDMFIRLKECPDERIILIDGDDPSLGESRIQMIRDDAFQKFEEYSKEQILAKPDEISYLNPKYLVFADFEGVIEIAPSAGWKKDPKTRKIIGVEGFGHPRPFTRYRLLISKIANVEAVDRQINLTQENQ